MGRRAIQARMLAVAARRPTAFAAAATAAVLSLFFLIHGCGRGGPPPLPARSLGPPATIAEREVVGPRLSEVRGEPAIRVRVAAGVERVTLSPASGRGALRLSAAGVGAVGEASARSFAPPVEVRSTGQAFRVRAGDGRTGTWRVGMLRATAAGGVTLDGVAYPGELTLYADGKGATAARPTLDAVNDLPMEAYLPGVLVKELFPDWSPAAFEAQAIAARSFAVFEQMRRGNRRFDVEASTVSQAYGGATRHRRALDAVAATRGEVLAWDGRVLPAFYSSSAGGRGQDASVAFPNMADLPPLRGRDHGHWGHRTPAYRWGPVTRDTETLGRRLAAWGRSRGEPIGRLRGVAELAVAEVGRSGRPAVFRVTDLHGRSYELRGEAFRYAMNHAADGDPAAGLPPLPKAQRLKSNDVTIARRGRQLVFTGRGHGHGVGMDQWGAEHLADTGYPAQDILAFYYPGATIVRAY